MTRLVEVGCRLRDDGMIGGEASLVKSDLGDFEPIDWTGSNAWVPVVQTTCEKIGCRSCGVVGERPASVGRRWSTRAWRVIHGLSTRPAGRGPVRRTRPQIHRTVPPPDVATRRPSSSGSDGRAAVTDEPETARAARPARAERPPGRSRPLPWRPARQSGRRV